MENLTLEQQEVVEHYGNASVSAAAGSGKSHCARAYCKARPGTPILYLAYNSSVRKEAEKKYAAMPHVTVETGHSLAYHAMQVGKKYHLRADSNLRVQEIVDLLKIEEMEDLQHFIIARHVIKHFYKFLNSAYDRPDQLRYLSELNDPDAREFFSVHRDRIVNGSTFLFENMRTGRIPLTHDCYLKLYQLSRPVLPYKAIIVDEGQDTNPPVLDIFMRQDGHKVIIGDEYQSIYGWRGAEDALTAVGDFPRFYLTGSFRFDQSIANLGTRALKLREWFGYQAPQFQIRGLGGTTREDTTAYITRSNIGLLDMAITHAEKYPNQKFAFCGGMDNYSFMTHGSSLFDLVYLATDQAEKIKGAFAKQFHDFTEVKIYAKQTDDAELRLACRMVDRYKKALIPLIFKVKGLQIPEKRSNIVFSSCHRAKGGEWDVIQLGDDFITGRKIISAIKKANKNGEKPDYKSMAEAVNVLYVAITRAKNRVVLPFDIETGEELIGGKFTK